MVSFSVCQHYITPGTLIIPLYHIYICKLPHPQTVLADLKELRASTSKLAKEYAAKAKVAPTAMDARDLMVEGTRALEGLYNTSVRMLVRVC